MKRIQLTHGHFGELTRIRVNVDYIESIREVSISNQGNEPNCYVYMVSGSCHGVLEKLDYIVKLIDEVENDER